MASAGGQGAIYKICDRDEWAAAQASGRYDGAAVDHADGFIHFSTADQVVETAERHFAGRSNLVLLTVDVESLGESLKWEPSRGGALFPHLYGTLSVDAVSATHELRLRPDGRHDFPALP